MTVNKSASIERIRDYLRRKPGHLLQIPEKEPYMAFSAEWQDWSFMTQGPTERLLIGYCGIVAGDYVNDPLLIVDWQSGVLIDIQISQYLWPELHPCGPHFAREFLDEVWIRHFDPINPL